MLGLLVGFYSIVVNPQNPRNIDIACKKQGFYFFHLRSERPLQVKVLDPFGKEYKYAVVLPLGTETVGFWAVDLPAFYTIQLQSLKGKAKASLMVDVDSDPTTLNMKPQEKVSVKLKPREGYLLAFVSTYGRKANIKAKIVGPGGKAITAEHVGPYVSFLVPCAVSGDYHLVVEALDQAEVLILTR